MLVVFILTTSVANADMRLSGQPCFDNAVTEALAGGDLQKIIQKHIHLTSIAAGAVWVKWRTRWKNLDEEHRDAAVQEVQNAIALVSDDFFKNIDFSSLVSFSKKTRQGYKVWGTYKSFSDEMPNNFELNIVMPDCHVVRVVYNNIQFREYVAGKLK